MNKKLVLASILMFALLLGCAQTVENGGKNVQPANQAQNESGAVNVSKMISKAVDYINSNLLRSSYNATLVNYTEYGKYLYRINLDFFKEGKKVGTDSVFITKDGDILVLNRNCIRDINKTFTSDPVENAVEYIRGLVGDGIKIELLNKTSYGKDLIRLRIKASKNGTEMGTEDVYITKDGGKMIMGRCVVDMYNKYNRQKVPIDKDDPYIGNENAKVVIVEFSDYACPYCAMFENTVLPKILSNYGDKIKVVFKDFPVHGEKSMQAANAARCAGEQGKFWDFHRLLFRNQMQWSKNQSIFIKYAKNLGLNVSKFKACMESKKYYSAIEKDRREGMSLGVSGTPTIFVNGIKLVGMQPYEKMSKIIDNELAKSKGS